MKPFLSVKANIDILRSQPFNKVLAGGVRRITASAALSYPSRLLLAVLVFNCHNLYGTSVLAIRTKTFLVVGGDSVRTGPTGTEHVCKIRQSGRFFVSIAGLVSYPQDPYDAYAITIDAIGRCQTIECAALNTMRAIKVPLAEVLNRIRRLDEAHYIAHFSTRAPLQIMIFGRVGTATAIRGINITVDTTKLSVEPMLDVSIECPGAACPEGTGLFAVGHALLAIEPAKGPLRSGEANNFAVALTLIKNGLALESLGSPDDVGPPYSIMIIEGSSIRWQEGYQGACPAIGK